MIMVMVMMMAVVMTKMQEERWKGRCTSEDGPQTLQPSAQSLPLSATQCALPIVHCAMRSETHCSTPCTEMQGSVKYTCRGGWGVGMYWKGRTYRTRL